MSCVGTANFKAGLDIHLGRGIGSINQVLRALSLMLSQGGEKIARYLVPGGWELTRAGCGEKAAPPNKRAQRKSPHANGNCNGRR